jgi:hypothetical protein
MKEPARWWKNPFVLALTGLALMLGGWKASTYIPTSSAKEQPAAEDAAPAQVSRGSTAVSPHGARLPFLLPGRIVFGAGLFLFIAAGVLMYRHQPAPTDEEPEPDLDEEREPEVF